MPKFKRRYKRDATQAEELELTGAVKQMQQTIYRAFLKNGEAVQDKIESGYSSDKNFIVSFTEKGTKIHKTDFMQSLKYDKRYNEDGQEIENIQYFEGALYQVTTQTYYSNKHAKENIPRDAEGKFVSKSVYTLNEREQLTAYRVYRGREDKLNEQTIHTYNDEGKLLSVIRYEADGSIDYKSENTYNEKGLCIEQRFTYTAEKKAHYNRHNTSEYNEHGDCILSTYYNPDGSVKGAYPYTYEYDSEGKRIVPTPKPFVYEEEEDYDEAVVENDSHGNWIKKTTYNNKSPLNIILRDIIYFDDPADKVLPPHPCTYAGKSEITHKSTRSLEMKEEVTKWIAEMPAASPENFPHYRYYTITFNDMPSQITYTGPNIAAEALLRELEESLSAQILHSYSTIWNGYKKMVRYTLSFSSYPGYLLHATNLTRHDADEFIIPKGLDISLHDDVYISQLQLFCPCEDSENHNDYFNDRFEQCIEKCTLLTKPEKPFINMIEVSGANFVLRQHAVDDNFEIRDLDINYGYGFSKFHDELMVRFNTSTKGLVLFHGEPGTGKTYYIRHLLRKMVSNKKVVIYMPPNMVDHLVEPAFMTFISTRIKDLSEDGNFCVLLIEDAEPLLAKRQEGVRIQGVTNLLNMTDGLLNDMLNLQIICTFNVGLRKLDSALLRPGRLIARKEFKALSELDANLLAQRLGIKHHFTAPATLGEIYAMRKHRNILIHEVEQDENSSNNIDDLV